MNRTKYILTLFLIVISCNLFSQKKTSNTNSEKPSVGLVLSGGGAKGFAYIGLLKVLEEVNMPIDYIGGSSIGAIVAGLYSVGYSPQTIEELIRNQDWNAVITDIQERKYLSYEEKLFSDKYIFSIPIQDSSISLSQAVSTSFNIDLMLNKLFAPGAHINDFSQLPIPFLCIGTDLISGEAVVLDSGNIARAIRASMAIPGYFTPIHYQGHYLVDGGVVNNYPAEQIKAKGLDYIIGGDVQAGLKSSIEELNSATAILDQIISFNRTDANNKGLELTDYFVKFKLPYGMMDFNLYDSIIAFGEKTARMHYAELKHIADSINELRNTTKVKESLAIADSIYIDDVVWRDIKLKQKDKDKYKGYFDELENKKVSFDDIEDRMRLLNGTKSFDELYYVLKSGEENKTNLKIIADEPSLGSLSAGIHYDNIYLGSALVNVALRNINGGRSKLFADIVLSQHPRLNAMFIINNGFKPGIGLETDLYSFSFPVYSDGKKVNKWNLDNIHSAVFMPLTIKNDFLFKVGLQYELFRFKQDVVVDTLLDTFNEFSDYGNVFISFNLDTRDKVYFTENGKKIELKLKHVFPFSNKWDDLFSNSTIVYLKYQQSVSLSKSIVFNPGLFLGYTFIKNDATPFQKGVGSSSSVQHLFGFGGLSPTNYIEGHIPFTGLRYIERFGQYGAILSVDLQYNFYKKLYITVMADAGINEMELTDIIADNILLGAGIKLSYNSFIGPVEFSVMNSNVNQGITGFLNLGFWF